MPPPFGFSFDREEANSAFRDFGKSLKEFTVTPTHKNGKSYVLATSLLDWLKSPWPGHTSTQAERLHKAVYHNLSGPFDPISPEQLTSEQNGCLLVFSILLSLRKGYLVDKFQRQGIIDKQIPVAHLEQLRRNISTMGLKDIEAKNLANSFYEKQWLFCPIVIFRNMDRSYEQKQIMPICQKQKINDKGGSAAGIYLIEVQEQFVSDDLKNVAVKYENKEDGFGDRYQFALKTFHENNRDLYANEIQAFKGLKNHGGMVQYLGEYSHEEYHTSGSPKTTNKTYNILLEYGELDLDEYFLERLPPVFPAEFLRFWKDLFEVGEAIKGVHTLKYGKGELAQDYYGWHADIKPDNILSVRGKFKLADPGFAQFVKKTDEIPMGELLGGTETFGAPECHPSRRRSQTAVHQTIDIWSLACVFSVAATWVALGYQGILQYAEWRKSAMKNNQQRNHFQPGFESLEDNSSSEDCFHNGNDVLPEVTSWHKTLRLILRKTDTVTSMVLDLIDYKMLLSDPTKRLSAEATCSELAEIYRKAEEAQSKLDSVPNVVTQVLSQLDDSAPPKALPKPTPEDVPPDLHSRNAKSRRLEVPLMKTTHRSERFKPLPHQISQQYSDTEEYEDAPSEDIEHNYLRDSGVQGLGPFSTQLALPLNPAQPQDKTLTRHISVRSFDISRRKQAQSRAPPQNVFEARQMLDKAHKGFRGKLGKLIGKPTKDELLSRHFNNRDLVFLVDNASSMGNYWSKATWLLTTLVMKAAGQDPDGPDLLFTLGSQGLKGCKHPSTFEKTMEHPGARPGNSESTDIRVSLGKIFENYLNKLENAKRRGSPVNELTIIVLTDGLWRGVGSRHVVDDQIVKFVKRVQELTNYVIPRHASIEFVQFGADPEATDHLRRLDDDLKFKGIPDVIDTEPAEGDIIKMLLGSFVENYDGDGTENVPELIEPPPLVMQNNEGMYMLQAAQMSFSDDRPSSPPPPRPTSGPSRKTLRNALAPGPPQAQSSPYPHRSSEKHQDHPHHRRSFMQINERF